jgi:hypothetical protein
MMNKWKKMKNEEHDCVLLDSVDMQNLMVNFFLHKELMIKIKKDIEVYGGPFAILVHLIYLRLIN